MRTALVLDDSAVNRLNVVNLLVELEFNVVECRNGAEGMQIVREKQNAGESVDLIVSDVVMPQMDGFQFLEQLRSGNLCDEVAFFFVTSLASRNDLQRAQRLEADGFFLKPLVAKQFVTKVVSVFPELSGAGRKTLARLAA